ncbi:MAG TPA: protease inhibitor I42 family protein [Casimicrobiaceae bacterium]
MKRGSGRAVLVALTAALLGACASHLPQAPTLVDASRAGGSVRLYKGDTLVVSLAPNATEGARWQAVLAPDVVLQQVGMADLLPPQVATGTVGSPNDTVYRFRANEAGTTTLAFAYRRADDRNAVPERTLRYEVAVLPRPGDYAEAWAKSR